MVAECVINRRFLLFVVITCVSSASIKKTDQTICSPVPEMVLSTVLGTAFNPRYMSMHKPVPSSNQTDAEQGKREGSGPESFYVDENFAKPLDEEPRWPWDVLKRKKRSTQMWQCETRVRWLDLGMDYYPRYLKSVECESKVCWFGRYKCKRKSFAIKVLRRKTDRCMVAKVGTSIGLEGLPLDLREMWIWEERALSFCCECAL
ncbi:hypothetical protein PPYR_06419 [Photinus pyralis]|uniref:Spaetzle domain-containing protein n=1 Tax=Photinus pyralis TaxID=7054 RepID=A0A1Y1K840_PHOPY|nr:protein trunk [Photinus pyralis]KAB0800680.1 hypothetical protein PPYR_06419 [Photinus pyralis]